MPKRETHTARDISDLATHFRQSWREGQVLRSWLRSHATEIRELVRDKDWSWENLGRVLSEAGVTYSTGAPWTGENLRRNLNRAELPGKREIKLQRMSAPEPEPPSPAAPIAGAAVLRGGIGDTQKSPTPEFQLIRRPADSGKPPVDVASLPRKQPRPRLTEAEIDAIVIGRSTRR